jgi:hypothetical protein
MISTLSIHFLFAFNVSSYFFMIYVAFITLPTGTEVTFIQHVIYSNSSRAFHCIPNLILFINRLALVLISATFVSVAPIQVCTCNMPTLDDKFANLFHNSSQDTYFDENGLLEKVTAFCEQQYNSFTPSFNL